MPIHRWTTTIIAGMCLSYAFAASEVPFGHADFHPSPERPIGWRCDNNGLYLGADPVHRWSPDENLVWRTELPNWSNTGCIVVGDKVLTFVEPHTMLASDARTGEIVWHNAADMLDAQGMDPAEAAELRANYTEFVRTDELYEKQRQHKKGKGPALTPDQQTEFDALIEAMKPIGAWDERRNRPRREPFAEHGFNKSGYGCMGNGCGSPVSDGEHVWISTGCNTVGCYEVATGEVRWLRWLGPIYKEADRKRDRPDTHHQFYASPVLVDGVLVVRSGYWIRGFDAATGRTLWEQHHGFSTAGTPAVLRPDGVRPIVVTCQGYAFRPSDGKRSELDWIQGGNSHHAILHDGRDTIYVNGLVPRRAQKNPTSNKVERRYRTYRLSLGDDGLVTAEQLCEIDLKDSQVTALVHDGRYYFDGEVWDVLSGEQVGGRFNVGHGYNGPVLAGDVVISGGTSVTSFPDGAWIERSNSMGLPKKDEKTDAHRAEERAFHARRQQAVEDGVIGWKGALPGHGGGLWSQYGQLPTFQGEHMFVRTRMHLWCFGPGPFTPAVKKP